jgi:hypothetical protein
LRDDGEVLGTIPQVAATYDSIHSAYPHMNEYQLAIAESTINQREELTVTRETGKQIMTVEQAEVFALQRCQKARDAVKLIGSLMETYGFLPSSGDGGEDLVVGDPEEAWVLEIFGVGPGWTAESGKPGAIWAAQRIGDDQALVIPNWSIIKEILAEDKENFMVSANYMQEAVDRGWQTPFRKTLHLAGYLRAAAGGIRHQPFWLFYSTFMPNLAQWPDRKLGKNPMTINPYHQFVEPLSVPVLGYPEREDFRAGRHRLSTSVFEGTIYDFTAQPQWLVSDGKGAPGQSAGHAVPRQSMARPAESRATAGRWPGTAAITAWSASCAAGCPLPWAASTGSTRTIPTSVPMFRFTPAARTRLPATRPMIPRNTATARRAGPSTSSTTSATCASDAIREVRGNAGPSDKIRHQKK